MSRRILIVTGIFPPELGGPATYAPELANRLLAHGYTVRLLCYSNTAFDPTDSDRAYPIIRVKRRGKISNYTRFFLILLKELRSVDFVYSLDWVTAGLPLAVASKLTGVPFIVRVGGGYIWEKYLSEGREPVTLSDFYKRGLHTKYGLLYRIIQFVFSRADTVVFNSEKQKKIYREFYPQLTEEKVAVIPNPAPLIRISTIRSEHLITNEIVFAGRFIKMKNVETLIGAFSKVSDKTLKLTLIGEGPLEASLRKLVAELGLGSQIQFLPPLPQKALYERIIHCRFLVLPSWTDISPNQVYESLQLGIPVLLTKEHYLDINIDHIFTIDPRSLDDIAEKIDKLSNKEVYVEFQNQCKNLAVKRNWDDVVLMHHRLFLGRMNIHD